MERDGPCSGGERSLNNSGQLVWPRLLTPKKETVQPACNLQHATPGGERASGRERFLVKMAGMGWRRTGLRAPLGGCFALSKKCFLPFWPMKPKALLSSRAELPQLPTRFINGIGRAGANLARGTMQGAEPREALHSHSHSATTAAREEGGARRVVLAVIRRSVAAPRPHAEPSGCSAGSA